VIDEVMAGSSYFFQEFSGYCLTTDTQFEVAVWLQGPMGCGKSTVLEGLQAMLGERCTQLGLAEIERSRFSLGNLKGKTLAVAAEQPAIFMQVSHIVNKIISGETITIERKFKDPWDFRPYAKVVWAMNEMPRVPSVMDGLFRRVKVIKFPPLEESRRDPAVKERIKTEGAGILNWSLEGLWRLQRRGRFDIPDCVNSATADFREHNDIPSLFVKERCLMANDYKTQSQLLYNAYKVWCADTGHKAMSSTLIAAEWERLGFEKYAANGRFYWRGVGINLEVSCVRVNR
jgi:putative DNA primase/helicase